jgi:hypothetical protein
VSNPNKAKGTTFESAIRDYLVDQGIPAYRPAQAGSKDVGDLHGVSPFVLQAKNYRDLASALRDGVDGAAKQHVNAKERWGAAVIKRSRRSTKDAYVVMDLATFAEVLAELRRPV